MSTPYVRYLKYSVMLGLVVLGGMLMIAFLRGTYQNLAGLLGLGLVLLGIFDVLRGRFDVEGYPRDREIRGWAARVTGAVLAATGVALVVANWPVF